MNEKDAMSEIKTTNNLPLDQKLTIGNKPKMLTIFLAILVVVVLALFVTGFGYQPWWLFVIILIIGLGISLPACFNQYWMIDSHQITVVPYSKNDFKKLGQLLRLVPKEEHVINLNDIKHAAIVYKKIVRLSPFDFNPDHLILSLTMNDGKIIELDLGKVDYEKLATIVVFMHRGGVEVKDKQEIVKLLADHENLFSHFHKKWATL